MHPGERLIARMLWKVSMTCGSQVSYLVTVLNLTCVEYKVEDGLSLIFISVDPTWIGHAFPLHIHPFTE